MATVPVLLSYHHATPFLPHPILQIRAPLLHFPKTLPMCPGMLVLFGPSSPAFYQFVLTKTQFSPRVVAFNLSLHIRSTWKFSKAANPQTPSLMIQLQLASMFSKFTPTRFMTEYYVGIKTNEILIQATSWMNF